MKKIGLFIPLLSLLSGCQMTRDEQLAIYRSRCLDYGYQRGTPEFADCMMKQEAHSEKLSIQSQKIQVLEEQNALKKQKLLQKQKKN